MKFTYFSSTKLINIHQKKNTFSYYNAHPGFNPQYSQKKLPGDAKCNQYKLSFD